MEERPGADRSALARHHRLGDTLKLQLAEGIERRSTGGADRLGARWKGASILQALTAAAIEELLSPTVHSLRGGGTLEV